MRALVADPVVREALHVASPTLVRDLAIWERDPEGKHGAKIELSLYRYLSRMASRATPFGLFAGCSLGGIAADARLELAARSTYRRVGRLDMDFVTTLWDALARSREARTVLRYRPASSLYHAAGRWRLVAATHGPNGRDYTLSSIEPTALIDLVLERAARGATLSELARAITDSDRELDLAEALEFVNALVDEQVLESELGPAVTGDDPIGRFIEVLAALPPFHAAAAALSAAIDRLRAMDASGLGQPIAAYDDVTDALAPLPVQPQVGRAIQIDLFKPAPRLGVSPAVIDAIASTVEIVHALGATLDPRLAEFAERFETRYGDREVPLLEALDEENGVGFARSPGPSAATLSILHTIPLPTDPASNTFDARDRYLLDKLTRTLATGAHEIALTIDDVRELAPPRAAALPTSFSVMATLVAASAEAVARDDFRVVLHGLVGPSAAKLLGRFCAGDGELTDEVRQLLRTEEALDPEAAFAEVVHLPEGRIGNVLLRPTLRDWELPFLGRSGAPADRQLALGDLMVSLVDRRVVLRSRRLGRRVIPRLTSAHNPEHARNVGIYRFLLALQSEGTANGARFSWRALTTAPFLPRVVLGRAILSPATWNLSEQELQGLARGHGNRAALDALRALRRLPRFVRVREGDTDLLVDLDDPIAANAFISLANARGALAVTEAIPTPDALCLESPDGAFMHELIVPFVRTEPPTVPRTVPDACASARVPSSLGVGSEWLFAKIYSGAAVADDILVTVVRPLVAELRDARLVDRWFFIRYADSGEHLRVRFRGRPDILRELVLPRLQHRLSELEANGSVSAMRLDLYQREIQRYGGALAIELAERLFQADSDATLELLEQCQHGDGDDLRWRLAVLGTDRLFTDMGLGLRQKLALAARLHEGYARGYRSHPSIARMIGERFRRERTSLEQLLDPEALLRGTCGFADAIFARRTARFVEIRAELEALRLRGLLSNTIEDLAGSYAHMHSNRLLRAPSPPQELILHDFLRRLYEGQQKRHSRDSGGTAEPSQKGFV